MCKNVAQLSLSVVLIDQIHHHLHHHVLLLRFALGNHQREGHEGVVSDALAAVFVIEDAVVVEEPKEQCGGDAFVAVAERVVLCSMHNLHITVFVQFPLLEHVADVSGNHRLVFLEQVCHLGLRKPNGFVLYAHINCCFAVFGLIDNNLFFSVFHVVFVFDCPLMFSK